MAISSWLPDSYPVDIHLFSKREWLRARSKPLALRKQMNSDWVRVCASLSTISSYIVYLSQRTSSCRYIINHQNYIRLLYLYHYLPCDALSNFQVRLTTTGLKRLLGTHQPETSRYFGCVTPYLSLVGYLHRFSLGNLVPVSCSLLFLSTQILSHRQIRPGI